MAAQAQGEGDLPNDEVFYLLSDHLGSTSVTVDESGAKVAELRYKAWGETRYSWGATPTRYRFTGQRQESQLGGADGLYDYGARWYDPSIMQFSQPDTLIPDPYNPLDWNRYSYARYNPLRFTDPSGYKACDGNNGNINGCDSVTSDDLIKLLRIEFRWYIAGEWSMNELYKLVDTGIDIEGNIGSLTNGNGRGWMIRNMGETLFAHGPLSDYALDQMCSNGNQILGMVPSGLPLVVIGQGGMEKQTIAHELAHIWDIKAGNGLCASTWCGGGPADMLATFVGGDPRGIRWNNGTSGIPPYYQWNPQANGGGYGNNSTADYFAETFSWMIYDSNAIPQPDVLLWLQAMIFLTGN